MLGTGRRCGEDCCGGLVMGECSPFTVSTLEAYPESFIFVGDELRGRSA